MNRFDTSLLLPGDAILYGPHDLLGWIIAVKTWTKVCHVEIYAGGGYSFASRNGKGVGKYLLRFDNIVAVRRPVAKLDLDAANLWFYSKADGQKYDWLGLLCFTLAVKHGATSRMFCSEFGTRFYRQAGCQPFDPDWDADRTPPAFFLVSSEFTWVWRNERMF